MKSLSARRIITAGIVSATAACALVVPGAASASIGQQCSGASVGGQGSSLQKIAQELLWAPGFNKSTDKFACSGKQGDKKEPTIAYNPSGSGAGLRSWGAEAKESKEIKFDPTNAFVGTDEPPNATQRSEIINQESTATSGTLMTIPVAQEAVAIIFHLPTGCTATSSAASGRLVLNDATLEGIFAGTVTTWGQLTDGGDTLTGTGCAADPIVPVVRFDQSGTTHIFKRYLGLIDTGTLETTSGSETWDDLSEGTLNTLWPTKANVQKPTVKGGGELIKKLEAVPGSIGYVNIAEAREHASLVPPAGGAKEPMFWGELENGTKGKGKSLKFTYADPANNGDVAALAESNCKKTAYTNGTNSFPPPSVTGLWNEVTTSVPGSIVEVKEKGYSLCGLTFDLAFTKYGLLEGKGATEAEATSVQNYLSFIADKKGGQGELAERDYTALPKEVDAEAVAGAKNIAF
jgi:ABC-type phosphate transport system substrate-binding protein